MYVVLVGGGKIGRYVAQDLREKGHEVTVIERVRDRAERLVTTSDVLVIEGDACDVRYLQQAHLDRADAIVATTHEDEDNLVACQLAKVEFGVQRAIARVNTPKNVAIFETLGIEPVSSTRLISELLESEFSVGDLVRLHSLKGGKFTLVEVRVPDDGGAPPRRVADLGLPHRSVLVAIFRGGDTVIPRGDTEVQPGDDVVALTTPELEDQLREILVDSA